MKAIFLLVNTINMITLILIIMSIEIYQHIFIHIDTSYRLFIHIQGQPISNVLSSDVNILKLNQLI